MTAHDQDYQTTFFRGRVTFCEGDSEMSIFEIVDGDTRIGVSNDIHVRLVEQVSMPPVFEIVAPMTHVVVLAGTVPEHYQIHAGHSYYRTLESQYVPLQLADAEKKFTQPKSGGCLSVVLLAAILSAVALLAQ